MQAIRQIHPACFGNTNLPFSGFLLATRSNYSLRHYSNTVTTYHSNPRLPPAHCLSQANYYKSSFSKTWSCNVSYPKQYILMKTILHYSIYFSCSLPHSFHLNTMSDQVLRLKMRRKASQVTEGTMGLKAASNLLWSGFEISDEDNL